MMTPAEAKLITDRALALVDRIKPILAGQGPAAQGAALAELLSLFLASHRDEDLREKVLAMHIEQVRELTKLNAKILESKVH